MTRMHSVIVLREAEPRVYFLSTAAIDISRAEAIRRSLAAHDAANVQRQQREARQPWQWLKSVWEAAR